MSGICTVLCGYRAKHHINLLQPTPQRRSSSHPQLYISHKPTLPPSRQREDILIHLRQSHTNLNARPSNTTTSPQCHLGPTAFSPLAPPLTTNPPLNHPLPHPLSPSLYLTLPRPPAPESPPASPNPTSSRTHTASPPCPPARAPSRPEQDADAAAAQRSRARITMRGP